MTRPSPTATTQQTPLQKVVAQYRKYVHGRLDSLVPQVSGLRIAVGRGDRDGAKFGWLTAQQTWEQIGAAYGALGTVGDAISGLANGLPLGVTDPGFTGLHRIEYGLYTNQPTPIIGRYVAKLASDLNTLRDTLDQIELDPRDMPIRCHEILEDSLRDHLTMQSDYGSGMSYALTSADIIGTRELLELLKPLFPPPVLGQNVYDTSKAALDILDRRVNATKDGGRWPYYPSLSKDDRQPVNGAIGAALEALYLVPQVLEGVN